MKKLLLLGMVAIGFVHQANAMMFKRNEKKQFIPAIQTDNFMDAENTKKNNVSGAVTPLIIVVKGSDDKPIMVPAKKYITKKSTTEKGEEILITEMVDAKDDKGNVILMQKTVLNDVEMGEWCRKFKKNSKKPGMWDKDYKEDKEINDFAILQYLNSGSVKESFKNIKDEVNFVDHKIEGIQVTYVDKREYKEDKKFAGLKLTDRKTTSLKDAQYFVNFDPSPYYKKGNGSLPDELENYFYHDALESLVATKEDMQKDLSNTSYFQWIWNNKKYKRTQDSLKGLNEEIAWFKQPENRNVFTKSCMHKDRYTQVKTSRE